VEEQAKAFGPTRRGAPAAVLVRDRFSAAFCLLRATTALLPLLPLPRRAAPPT